MIRGVLGSILLGLGFIGQSLPNADARYLVTAAPLDVGISTKLCIAVNATEVHGVWWWEPGNRGCSNRSTGPGVFRADAATVSRTDSAIEAGFRIQLHARPGDRGYFDVRLTIEGGRIRSAVSAEGVPVSNRGDLEIPGP